MFATFIFQTAVVEYYLACKRWCICRWRRRGIKALRQYTASSTFLLWREKEKSSWCGCSTFPKENEISHGIHILASHLWSFIWREGKEPCIINLCMSLEYPILFLRASNGFKESICLKLSSSTWNNEETGSSVFPVLLIPRLLLFCVLSSCVCLLLFTTYTSYQYQHFPEDSNLSVSSFIKFSAS